MTIIGSNASTVFAPDAASRLISLSTKYEHAARSIETRNGEPMRVDVSPRRKNAPRPAEKSAPGFLQWIRGRHCLAAGSLFACSERIESAHVDYAGDKGVATKVSDRYAIPLCSKHHHHQHATGWKSFETKCLLMPVGSCLKAAENYWRQWPGRRAWEAKNG
jgi:hypothetical protein